MSPRDSAKPNDHAEPQQDNDNPAPANPAVTRAAQAFVRSPQMKVLADIQQARIAKRSLRA